MIVLAEVYTHILQQIQQSENCACSYSVYNIPLQHYITTPKTYQTKACVVAAYQYETSVSDILVDKEK